MPNPPANANYFGPPTPGGPPQWAPGPAPGNMGQPPGGGPPNSRPPGGWGPAMDNFPPQHGNRNNYYYYYNARPLPRAQNPQDNTRNALAWEGKLNIQKPEPFTGHDPWKWQIFPTQCLTMFQAKPITFQLESSQVAFTASYLQSIAFDHYTTLLWFDSNNPVLSNWLAFTQEFSSKFGVFDTVAEAEENLFNLQMCDNKRFTTFIVQFEREAYKTGWNYNALRFALCRTLPQQIKDVLCLIPKQTTYDRYKVLVTQVNQCYWEDCSKNTVPQTPWNASDRGPDPNVFSTPATLLHAMILAPDSPPVHLPSHSSTNLLLHTTLPFTTNPIPTLVDSGATNNFIDESLAALTPHPLQCLPTLIPLKLFDGDPTPAGDITHCLETTMTFTNG
ncbi:hypothetical protein C0989_002716 [Termitomyces sp. Mn162]|nr:hypothetical protein C0989_002716 [Termitomyces sp. Mn162]